jgi:hypothetical protein
MGSRTGPNYLAGVAAVSTSDVWAGGYAIRDYFYETRVEHCAECVASAGLGRPPLVGGQFTPQPSLL